MLDDKVRLATVRIVRYGAWVLVCNDGYVLGGYDYRSGRLVGEHEWTALPFTVWRGSGIVVSETRKVQVEQAVKPLGLELVEDQGDGRPAAPARPDE